MVCHPHHALRERERGAIPHQVGPASRGGVETLQESVIDGQHSVFDGLLDEQFLKFLELRRVNGGQVVRQAEVLARVVELARLADGVDEAADLVVAVLPEAGIDLHLAGEELLLIGRQLVPVLDTLGLRCELGPCGHHVERDLPGQRRFLRRQRAEHR